MHHEWRSTILHWSSPDLVQWSPQRILPVWGDLAPDVAQTWAPEFVWDAARSEYLIFWAVLFHTPKHLDPKCDNPQRRRHLFWATRTADFQSFAPAFELYDPGCRVADFAPDAYSEGGIDGNIVRAPHDGLYYLFYKDGRAPTPTGEPALQRTSGVRVASSADLRHWSAAAPRVALFAGPWGTEGPELLLNGTEDAMRLYFDCSWQPTPPGMTRPPFGVARAPYPDGFTDRRAWRTVPGSCTGNDTAAVRFPTGASQGSFNCLDQASYEGMARKLRGLETRDLRTFAADVSKQGVQQGFGGLLMAAVGVLLARHNGLDALAWYGGEYPFEIVLTTLFTHAFRRLSERIARHCYDTARSGPRASELWLPMLHFGKYGPSEQEPFKCSWYLVQLGQAVVLIGVPARLLSVGLILLSMAALPPAASPVRLIAAAWYYAGLPCGVRTGLILYATPLVGDAVQFVLVDQIQKARSAGERLLGGGDADGIIVGPQGAPDTSSSAVY